MFILYIRNLDQNNSVSTFNVDNSNISCRELFKLIVDEYECDRVGMDHPNNNRYNNISFGNYIQNQYYPISEEWGKPYLDYCKRFHNSKVWFYIYGTKLFNPMLT